MKNAINILSWGLSMYGGYYINYSLNGVITGVHASTLKECINKLGIKKRDLKQYKRFDN